MLDRGRHNVNWPGDASGFARNFRDTISISRRRKRVDQSPMRAVAIDLPPRVISFRPGTFPNANSSSIHHDQSCHRLLCVSFTISAQHRGWSFRILRTLFASVELRDRRRGYVRLRKRSYPGSIAHAAGIDRHIVHSPSVCRAPRNTTDRNISHRPRTGGSRKSCHCPQTGVSAAVSASRK